MARTIRMIVPAEQADAIRDMLLTLYQVKEDALETATRSPGPQQAADVQAHREELAALDDLLHQAGEHAPTERLPLELVGPPRLLREAVYGALLGSTEAVERVCRAYEAGRASLEDLRARISDLTALFAAFAEIEERTWPEGW
jgi:hypothetical protein